MDNNRLYRTNDKYSYKKTDKKVYEVSNVFLVFRIHMYFQFSPIQFIN